MNGEGGKLDPRRFQRFVAERDDLPLIDERDVRQHEGGGHMRSPEATHEKTSSEPSSGQMEPLYGK
jgi:hypothetical protein